MSSRSENNTGNQEGDSNPTDRGTADTSGTNTVGTDNNGANTRRQNNRNGNRGNNNGGNNSGIRNFKGEVPEVGAVLGISSEQRDMKDRYMHLIEKLVAYISRDSSYENARDVIPLLLKLEDPTIALAKSAPKELGEKEELTYFKKQRYNIELKKYFDKEEILKDNIFKLFSLIWGQLTKALQGRIKKEPDYDEKCADYDTLWLLRQVKKHAANVDHTDNVFKTAVLCLRSFFAIKQGQHETADEYRKRFEGIFSTLEILGFSNILRMDEFAKEHAKMTPDTAEDRLKAMTLLLGSDPNQYGSLLTDLDEQMILGNDNFPKDVGATYDVISRYTLIKKKRNNNRNGQRDRGNDSGGRGGNDRNRGNNHFQFLQQHSNETRAGANGEVHPGMPRCYNCGYRGHMGWNCPDPDRRVGTQSLLMRWMLAQGKDTAPIIDPNWILLDTCSTVTSFMNPDLLRNVRECEPGEEMTVLANGHGVQDYHMCGQDIYLDLDAYLEKSSIANIVAMIDAEAKYRITMDTKKYGAVIYVHLDDNNVMKFQQCGQGLYYFDTTKDTFFSLESASLSSNNNKQPITEYCLVNTVRDNKQFFSRREIEQADTARILQQNLDWPSNKQLKYALNHNLIRDCPVVAADVDRADAIYGPAVPILKGKMVRRKPQHYQAIPRVPLPANLSAIHRTIDIYVDFFYVNGKPFLHTKCKPQDFLTVDRTPSRSLSQVKQRLDHHKAVFEARGFSIGGIHGDNEFRPLAQHYAPIPVHTTAAGEHNGVIERSIRTLEERARCHCHATPFPKVPHIMIEHLLLRIVSSLISFPSKTGISQHLSPKSIILGTPTISYNNISLAYGAYCQVYTTTDNSMRQRTVGAIALRPSNERGGFYFMSLNSGRLIHAYAWNVLPVDDYVIDRVVTLASNDNAPVMNNGPIFEWRPGIPVNPDEDEFLLPEDADDDDVSVADPPVHDAADGDPDDDDAMSIDEPAPHDPDTDFHHTLDDVNIPNEPFADAHHDDNPPVVQGARDLQATTNNNIDVDTDDDDTDTHHDVDELDNTSIQSHDSHSDPDISYDTEDDFDADYTPPQNSGAPNDDPPPATRRSNRTNAGTGVDRLNPSFHGKHHESTRVQLLNIINGNKQPTKEFEDEVYRHAVNVMFAQTTADNIAMTEEAKNVSNGPGGTGSKQMSAKKGIKLFGQRAIAALYKEYKQFNDLVVFAGLDPKELTEEQKLRALDILNTIKEKRCGTIKARSVADGRKQRGYVTKEESSSPTLTLEGLIMSLVIDVFEGRDVGIFDVPGAFLQAPFPDDKFVIAKFVGEFVDIMVEVNPELAQFVTHENGVKVLYLRLLKALYGCMESALLWFNLYSEVLKTMDFELNPYDKCVANRTIEGSQQTICFYVDDNKISHLSAEVNTAVMDAIEKRFGKLTITRGDAHDFLGMKIKILKDAKFSIDLRDHIKEAIKAFGEDVSKSVTTPATKQLKEHNPNSPILDKERAEKFQSIVMKLLWIAKRGRPDIDPTITYLTTRISKSRNEDWFKLKRVLQFLNATIDDIRVIGADNIWELFTWIDAAYAVHEDMRSHTGGAMSFGWGIIHYLTMKQRLNVKSSTEAEVVGLSDYVPFNTWMRLFLEAQGYKLSKNVIYQDNQSAIKMEKNGRNSCTGNSRHIHIRFFFVADRYQKNEFSIEYCPTYQMLGDYYTKPLQGQLFRRFRAVIMGWEHINSLKQYSPPSKERVGDSVGDIDGEDIAGNIPKPSYADIVRKEPTRLKLEENESKQ